MPQATRRYPAHLSAIVEDVCRILETVCGVILLPGPVLPQEHGWPVAYKGHHGVLLLSALQTHTKTHVYTRTALKLLCHSVIHDHYLTIYLGILNTQNAVTCFDSSMEIYY